MANRPVEEPRVRERLLVNRQPWAGVESGSVDAAAGSHNNSAGGPEGALIADGPTKPVPAGAMAIALAHTGPAHMARGIGSVRPGAGRSLAREKDDVW